MAVKISILGAGSGIFSLNMIRDLCLTENLQDSEICFMDIDEKRLDASYTLCMRLAKQMGMRLNLSKTTSREEALRGADFVVNTILIGGYKGWKEGWSIAKKWGYRMGGSMHIMHDEAFWINFYQLRMIEEVQLDIKRICPNAWYLLVSNPVMAATTYLRRKYPEMKMVGLCHGTGMIRTMAKTMGLDIKRVSCEIPGINHFVWMNEFYYDGKDAFPLLDRWLEEHGEEYFANCEYSDGMGPKPMDLYHRYGVMPIGDTANPGGGAWGYPYHSDREVEESWKEDPDTWFNKYFDMSADRVKEIEQAAYDETKDVLALAGKEHSGEPMIPLIESLACGVERNIVVNVLNDHEYVPGFPRDFEVEVPAFCGSHGVQPIVMNPLPRAILAHAYHDRIAPVEMELAAFDAHDKNLLVDLVMMDPRSQSLKQAEGLVNEIFDLPYHSEMKEWYGGK